MPEAPRAAFEACLRAPFATLGITTSGKHVTGIRFLAPTTPAAAPRKGSLAHLVCVQLQAYLEDGRYEFDLPLALAGTRHRLAVWEAMQRIPAGATRTYGELAREIRSSARAVGGACGANPIPVVVPCHRVIGAGGDLGGFMGERGEGFERDIKRWLLGHEGALGRQ
ncbi:MAG TPA: methylated-DNA--[protein]-cysteine S-methyltransferase [Usitatibacter sp.]|nr:methylated-DNA--[protein]-cysteine S-methyltransferase [Usitatibacter sp.]